MEHGPKTSAQHREIDEQPSAERGAAVAQTQVPSRKRFIREHIDESLILKNKRRRRTGVGTSTKFRRIIINNNDSDSEDEPTEDGARFEEPQPSIECIESEIASLKEKLHIVKSEDTEEYIGDVINDYTDDDAEDECLDGEECEDAGEPSDYESAEEDEDEESSSECERLMHEEQCEEEEKIEDIVFAKDFYTDLLKMFPTPPASLKSKCSKVNSRFKRQLKSINKRYIVA